MSQFLLGHGSRQLCRRSFGLQAQIVGIQFGQQLAFLHPRAGIDMTLLDLAADAKGQGRFLASADIAGQYLPGGTDRHRLHHHGRAQGRFCRRFGATGCQGHDQREQGCTG